MSTEKVAKRLAELCRKGEFETAQKELFADDAISIEPNASPEFEKETKGLKAILEKGHKFNSMVEKVHGLEVSDPLVNGNMIALGLTMDMQMKGHDRSKMGELCVYHVKNDKIVSEQFFM